MFLKGLKRTYVYSYIALVILFTFTSILSVWEVLEEESLEKSLSSLGILTFGFVLALISIHERQNDKLPFTRNSKGERWNFGQIILLLFVGYVVLSFLSNFFYF